MIYLYRNYDVFNWDPRKDHQNQRKHGVTFEEASSAFFDENAIAIYDPDHSDEEDRFLLIGMSVRLRVLIISHTYRNRDERIRIISARQATRQERRQYEEGITR